MFNLRSLKTRLKKCEEAFVIPDGGWCLQDLNQHFYKNGFSKEEIYQYYLDWDKHGGKGLAESFLSTS